MVTMLEIICYPAAQTSPPAFILGSDKHLTGKGTSLVFAQHDVEASMRLYVSLTVSEPFGKALMLTGTTASFRNKRR
jgi:hypothetical protein